MGTHMQEIIRQMVSPRLASSHPQSLVERPVTNLKVEMEEWSLRRLVTRRKGSWRNMGFLMLNPNQIGTTLLSWWTSTDLDLCSSRGFHVGLGTQWSFHPTCPWRSTGPFPRTGSDVLWFRWFLGLTNVLIPSSKSITIANATVLRSIRDKILSTLIIPWSLCYYFDVIGSWKWRQFGLSCYLPKIQAHLWDLYRFNFSLRTSLELLEIHLTQMMHKKGSRGSTVLVWVRMTPNNTFPS